eukprot:1181302-Prorocentrum_minimum.AAC.3
MKFQRFSVVRYQFNVVGGRRELPGAAARGADGGGVRGCGAYQRTGGGGQLQSGGLRRRVLRRAGALLKP